MEKVESLKGYYERTNKPIPYDLLQCDSAVSHLNILRRHNCCTSVPFQRNDYYKITLFNEPATIHTEQGILEITQPCIIFSNPKIKYGWQSLGGKSEGYICLFNESYLSPSLKATLATFYNRFEANAYPFLLLTESNYLTFRQYFQQMENVYNNTFEFKTSVLRNLLELVFFLGLEIQETQSPKIKPAEPSDRIVIKFLQLLESQFPVDSPLNAIPYRTAGDFAAQLFVHVNHLNHSIKMALGKSTTEAINDRIISEAKALLKNSDWTIAEIANSLGFEYPQHFTLFFKRETSNTPRIFRQAIM